MDIVAVLQRESKCMKMEWKKGTVNLERQGRFGSYLLLVVIARRVFLNIIFEISNEAALR